MKLTVKDKEFLEKLKALLDKKELRIKRVIGTPSTLVLRQNYGDRIESHFGMTRQGVRWRFQHIFGKSYISAYETVYWIESSFGTSLRTDAFEIVRERVEMRKKMMRITERPRHRRQSDSGKSNDDYPRL